MTPLVLMDLQLSRHGNEIVQLGDTIFVQDIVMPHVVRSLVSDCVQVRIASLKEIPKICSNIRLRFGEEVLLRLMKSSLVDRLASNCVLKLGPSNNLHESICVHALIAVSLLLKDKCILSENLKLKLLPALQLIKNMEVQPAIALAIIDVLNTSAELASPQMLAKDIIPLASTLLTVKGLNRSQFDGILQKLRSMLSLVEESQHRVLGNVKENKSSDAIHVRANPVPLPLLGSKNKDLTSSLNVKSANNFSATSTEKKTYVENLGDDIFSFESLGSSAPHSTPSRSTLKPAKSHQTAPRSSTSAAAMEVDPFGSLTAGLKEQNKTASAQIKGNNSAYHGRRRTELQSTSQTALEPRRLHEQPDPFQMNGNGFQPQPGIATLGGLQNGNFAATMNQPISGFAVQSSKQGFNFAQQKNKPKQYQQRNNEDVFDILQ